MTRQAAPWQRWCGYWRLGLFPSVADPVRRRPGVVVLGYLLVCGTATGAVLLRTPSALTTLWAEDGTVFLPSARASGCAALVTPYAGYLNALPRLYACAVARAPLDQTALLFGTLAALTMGGAAAMVVRASRHLVPALTLRLALAGVLVLSPLSGNDVAGAVTNVQWVLLVVCFWVLLWRDQVVCSIVAGLVALAATTTCPLTLVLAPLALARFLLCRRLLERIVPVAYALGALAQVAAIASTTRARPMLHPRVSDLVVSFLARVCTVGVLGPTWAGRALGSAETVTLLVAGLGLGVVLVLGWVTASKPERRAPLVLTASTCVALYLVTVVRVWNPLLGYGDASRNLVFANRYFFAPVALLWVLVALAAQECLAACAMWHFRGRRGLLLSMPAAAYLIALGLLFAVGVVRDGRLSSAQRVGVPGWRPEVQAGLRACRTGAASVELRFAPPGYAQRLTCPQLAAAS